ncbi:DegQ family serine endoprotease [Pseudomonadota bacterium]
MSHRKLLFFLPFLLCFSLLSVPLYAVENGGIANLRQTSKAFASVAKAVSPSVAFIKVESVQKGAHFPSFPSPFEDDFFKRFFGDRFPGFPQQRHPQNQPERRVMGQGSGFVFKTDKGLMSDTSYILTNNHVVEGADKIRVTFQDGREFDATVKGTDSKSDIAILEIKGSEHPPLPMGNSATLDVGEWVIALGNPFGLSHTLTVGVVSAKGRSGLGINDYEDFIQTDAAINPGNSGGPLLNLDGEVVGINTAIFSRSGGYMGVGFAIPINLAKNIADQLIDSGEVTRGYLGIVIQNMTPELAESFDIDDKKGILVAQVSEDSPAEKAGLKVGDLIVRYQGEQVTEVAGFRNRVALTPPGTRANITVMRNGKRKVINVKIGNLGEDQVVASASTGTADELGLTVQTLTPDLARQFDAKAGQGVVVTEVKPGSVAPMGGIRTGTVILQVNQKAVNSSADFQRAVASGSNQKRVLLLVSDRGMSRYVVLSWR